MFYLSHSLFFIYVDRARGGAMYQILKKRYK